MWMNPKNTLSERGQTLQCISYSLIYMKFSNKQNNIVTLENGIVTFSYHY